MRHSKIFSISLLIIVVSTVACTTLPEQNSQPVYTSAYHHEDLQVGKLQVRDHTSAPLRLLSVVHLDVPVEKAFDAVLKELDNWGPGIEAVTWNHTASLSETMGVGSYRQCTFKGDQLHEDIVYYEKNRIYAYAVNFDKSNINMPIENHLGVFIVEDDGAGGSLVTWRIYFDGKYFGLGPIMEVMLDNMVVKKGMKNLAHRYDGTILSPVNAG